MPRMYSSSVRRQIVARLRSGEAVAAWRPRRASVRPLCFGGSAKRSSTPALSRAPKCGGRRAGCGP